MENTRRSRAEETRAALLDAAEACFAEAGFEATRLRQVAARAGVTQPLIFHYFASKEALYAAVLERAVSAYEAAQAEQWARSPTDPAFFTEGLRVLFTWVGANPRLVRLARWGRLEGRLPMLPGGDALMLRVRQRFLDAQAAGLVRPGVSIDAALLVIDVLFKGFWERTGDPGPLDVAALADDYFALALEMVVGTLLAPAPGR
ncbi:MAG: helix-turn-helix domain-containing protein [Myxococcota bacterium]